MSVDKLIQEHENRDIIQDDSYYLTRKGMLDYSLLFMVRATIFEHLIKSAADSEFSHDRQRRDLLVKIQAIKDRIYEIGNELFLMENWYGDDYR